MRTPWFPGTVKPVYVGVYVRRRTHSIETYNYWDGTNWHVGDSSPVLAYAKRGKVSMYQTSAWAGEDRPTEVATNQQEDSKTT